MNKQNTINTYLILNILNEYKIMYNLKNLNTYPRQTSL